MSEPVIGGRVHRKAGPFAGRNTQETVSGPLSHPSTVTERLQSDRMTGRRLDAPVSPARPPLPTPSRLPGGLVLALDTLAFPLLHINSKHSEYVQSKLLLPKSKCGSGRKKKRNFTKTVPEHAPQPSLVCGVRTTPTPHPRVPEPTPSTELHTHSVFSCASTLRFNVCIRHSKRPATITTLQTEQVDQQTVLKVT